MWFVKNPESFDVVVSPNMFGDIITDLGAMIQGGLGLAPGGNINPEGTSMFEPIHGSAPRYRGLGVANPVATIWAGSMLLDHLGEHEAAAAVLDGIGRAITSGVKTRDMGGHAGTSDVGDFIAAFLRGPDWSRDPRNTLFFGEADPHRVGWGKGNHTGLLSRRGSSIVFQGPEGPGDHGNPDRSR